MASTHFQLNQPVKIDGVDFQPGAYPISDIDAGRRGSISNAGWGDYCDAPKAQAKAKTDDENVSVSDPELDQTPPAKTARSRKR